MDMLVLAMALAQAMPPIYQHPPRSVDDPYPVECCHNQDCQPWPTEDVVLNRDGSYSILSLRETIPREKVKETTSLMMQYTLKRYGEVMKYHLCIVAGERGPEIVCFFAKEEGI